MLNVNAAGISSSQIANQLLIWRRVLKRITGDNVKKAFRLRPEVGGRYFFASF
jgi:hypothetical protein